jgi:hypothetical protein
MARRIKIISVRFDWFATESAGEEYKQYDLGSEYFGKVVVQIIHHTAQGEGDKHYCEVQFNDGSCEYVYNLNRVIYSNRRIKNE